MINSVNSISRNGSISTSIPRILGADDGVQTSVLDHQTTPGSVLPPEVPVFDEFRTIKIEVGVSQPWGMAQGQLDHKAISVWAVMPGVEYVLCGKIDPDFAKAEYKLYDARVNPLAPLGPLPRTEIHLDGRRILGIPRGMALPIGFPRTLSVDLYSPFGMGNAFLKYQRLFYAVCTRFLLQTHTFFVSACIIDHQGDSYKISIRFESWRISATITSKKRREASVTAASIFSASICGDWGGRFRVEEVDDSAAVPRGMYVWLARAPS
ncbi:unnamed protein product [Phytophthora lilii]|uniref:Unnamed protein product n=1 Tax=Phytophthora lilii TaxID=2077276 RepID=A0A9W6X4C4_9STRA|nr:unnamed protein product [Phytophthora lilii]